MLDYVKNLTERYPELTSVREDVIAAIDLLEECYRSGGRILLCGNGGSAADCEHIAGELLKGFLLKRAPEGEELSRLSESLGADAAKLQRGVPAIPLPSFISALSAFANDVAPELVYAQLVYAISRPGDVLISLSTSGNSRNAVLAAKAARSLGVKVISLTGEGGGELGTLSDVTVKAPERETYKVQELHLPIYHSICAELERRLFAKGDL